MIRKGRTIRPISIAQGFLAEREHGLLQTLGELNGQAIKLVTICGSFPWHRHDAGDQMFLVWQGELRVEFKDQAVTIRAGDLIVVPKGVEHRTMAEDEAQVLVLEPSGILAPANSFVGEPLTACHAAARENGSGKRHRTPWGIRSGDCDFPGAASFPYQATTVAAKGRGPRLTRPIKLG